MKILIKLNKFFVFSFLFVAFNLAYSKKQNIESLKEEIKTEIKNQLKDFLKSIDINHIENSEQTENLKNYKVEVKLNSLDVFKEIKKIQTDGVTIGYKISTGTDVSDVLEILKKHKIIKSLKLVYIHENGIETNFEIGIKEDENFDPGRSIS